MLAASSNTKAQSSFANYAMLSKHLEVSIHFICSQTLQLYFVKYFYSRSTDRTNDASESAGERRVEERLADFEEEVNSLRVVLAHRQGLQQFA